MIIEMSLDHYDRLLEKCDASSREWQILKNGLIVRRPNDGHYERIMEIACEVREAQLNAASVKSQKAGVLPACQRKKASAFAWLATY
jgi:hypothetical protein